MIRSWLNAFVWEEFIAGNKQVVVVMRAIYHILVQKTKPHSGITSSANILMAVKI